MANVLSLAMKVSADASSVPKQLTPVERALANLGKQAEKATSVLDKLAAGSAAAAAAQARAAGDFEKLAQALRDGLDPQEYARRFAALTQAAQDTASAFAEGLRVTEANRTEEERRAEQLQRLAQLLELGAISEETFNRAKAEASGANAAAAQAEKERLDALAAAQRERDKLLQDGVRITQQFATEEERRAQQIAQLDALLEAAAISEETYARAKEQASGASKAAADAEAQRQALLQEGSRLTEQYRTTEERRAAEIERINKLLAQGAISEETAARAKAEASGANAEAAKAEQERATLSQRAAQIIEQGLTAQERAQRAYATSLAELDRLRAAGLLTSKQYADGIRRTNQEFVAATTSAQKYGQATQQAGRSATLAFNELSGIAAILPGSLGNIAGRMSGIASASEGLNRVFAGGLRQGFSNVASSLTSFANPLTIATAGIAGFGAAAAGIVSGLASLEGRFEGLSNAALRLGTDFGTIQVLEEAARRSGQSLEAAASAIQKFSVNLDKARTGTGDAAKAFEQLGISQQELRNSDPTTLAQQTAQALQRIEDPAKRAALAVDTLGKNGLSLLPLFNAVGEGEQALAKFGATVSDIDNQRVAALGSSFDDVKVALSALGTNALLPFAGLVEGAAKVLASLLGVVSRVADALGNVLGPALDAVGGFLGLFGDGVNRVVGFLFGVEEGTKATAKQLANLKVEAEKPLAAMNKQAQQLQRTLADVQRQIGDASRESSNFGNEGAKAFNRYATALDFYKQRLSARTIDEDTYKKIVAEVTAEYRRQIDTLKQAREEIQRKAEADRQLIANLREQQQVERQFGGDEQRARAAENRAAIEREINRLVKEAGRARDGARVEEERAIFRQISGLRELSQEQLKVIDGSKQDADEAEKARQAAIDRVNELLGKTQERTQLEKDTLFVQQQQDEAIREQYQAWENNNQAAANAAAARLAELDQLQAKLDEQQQAIDQGFGQGFEADFQQINTDLNSLADRASEFGNAGAVAFDTLKKGVEEAQQQARDGILNKEALDQQVGQQRQAFENELKNIDAAKKARDQAIAENNKRQEEAGRALVEAQKAQADAQRQQQEQILEQQKQAAEERRKAEEAEYNRQAERITALNTLGSRSVQTADVRTQEGAAIVLGLAANEQDPQLIQARLTNKVLNRIAASIDRDLNRLGQPALILP